MDRYPQSQSEWRQLYETVLTYAKRRTFSPDRAQNVTQEAFKRLYTTRPWQPERQAHLDRHLLNVVKSLLFNETVSQRPGHENAAATEDQTITGGVTRSAEQTTLDHAAQLPAARQVAVIRERLKGHDLELRLLDLYDEGVVKAEKQAEALKLSVPEIYEARRRLKRLSSTALKNDRPEREEAEEALS